MHYKLGGKGRLLRALQAKGQKGFFTGNKSLGGKGRCLHALQARGQRALFTYTTGQGSTAVAYDHHRRVDHGGC